MATTTRVLDANVNGTVYTSNANSALEALDTCHSGATAPTDEVANGKLWLDTSTTPGILKIYNNATWEVVVNTTNVTASGALMDSELTDIASVKALDQGVATTDSPTFADVTASSLVVNGNNYPSAGALSNRNLIINGAMQVSQRGTSVAGVSGSGYYVCDRWQYRNGSAGTGQEAIHEQSTDAPSGFQNSYKVSCTVADATPLASENEMLSYKLEGYDVSQLDYGTSSAKTVTLSFWVKSTVTGAYGVQFFSSSTSPSALKSYNISSASTWEYKTIRLDGDTITPFPSGSVQALTILFHLACGPDDITSEYEWTSESGFRSVTGQANVFATTSDTFQITGVQLEVGDTATPFEHRSYGQELALCQRYYYIPPQGPLHIVASGKGIFNISPPVQFRATPTASIGRTNPYVENVPWTSVGTVSGIGLDSGHLNENGGDLLLSGTYVQAHSYGDIWVLGPNELSIDAEL